MPLPQRRALLGAGFWFASGAALGFSLKAIFIKLAYVYGVTSLTLLALRMGFALPFFLLSAWISRAQKPSLPAPLPITGEGRNFLRSLWPLALSGLFGYYASSLLDFYGLRFISSALERLILFTYPALTLVGACLLHRRSFAWSLLWALLLTYGGLGLAFVHDLLHYAAPSAAERWRIAAGCLLVFGSALSFAVYLLQSGALIAQWGATRFTSWVMLLSTLFIFLHFAAFEPLRNLFIQPWPVYGWALAMALCSTVLPVYMQSAAIARIGAERSAIIGTAGPVLTIAMGWWILGEPWSIWQIGGAALVLAGMWQARR